MLYELTFSLTPNSYSYFIVTSPTFDGGVLHCTIVAEFIGLTDNSKNIYMFVNTKNLIVGGGTYSLKQYTGKILPQNPNYE